MPRPLPSAKEAQTLLAVLTPVVKAYLTQLGHAGRPRARRARRLRLHARLRHRATRARQPHRHDLRGHQRDPGHRPVVRKMLGKPEHLVALLGLLGAEAEARQAAGLPAWATELTTHKPRPSAPPPSNCAPPARTTPSAPTASPTTVARRGPQPHGLGLGAPRPRGALGRARQPATQPAPRLGRARLPLAAPPPRCIGHWCRLTRCPGMISPCQTRKTKRPSSSPAPWNGGDRLPHRHCQGRHASALPAPHRQTPAACAPSSSRCSSCCKASKGLAPKRLQGPDPARPTSPSCSTAARARPDRTRPQRGPPFPASAAD